MGHPINGFQFVHRVTFKPCCGVLGELDPRTQEVRSSPFISFRVGFSPARVALCLEELGGQPGPGWGLGCVQVKAPGSWQPHSLQLVCSVHDKEEGHLQSMPARRRGATVHAHRFPQKEKSGRPSLGIPARPFPPPPTCTERSPGPRGDTPLPCLTLSHQLLPFPGGRALGIWPCPLHHTAPLWPHPLLPARLRPAVLTR